MTDTRVTIQAIAQKAGVSHQTVSSVLNDRANERRISIKTQEHVLRVAHQLNYRPNYLARGLRGGKTQTIGMLVGGPYLEVFGMKIEAIEEIAAAHGYLTFGCYHGGNLERERKILQELMARQVDGLIVSPVDHRSDGTHFLPLVEQKIPLVFLDKGFAFPANCVQTNFVEGGAMAVRHLMAIGRRKIAFLSGSMAGSSLQARREGWRRACAEANLDFDSLPLYSADFDASPEVAYQLCRQLVSSGRPFDAIVASNDVFASSAMKVLVDHGYRIPQDVAIIGFDDNLLSKYLLIPLTTIRQPAKALGEAAFQIFLKCMEDPSRPPEQIVLDAELIVRESTMGKR